MIEVIWTSGGTDKLEAYRRLGVSEVWFWKNDAVEIYVLEGEAFLASAHSRCLPELDMALLLSCMSAPTAIQAVKAFRRALTAAR